MPDQTEAEVPVVSARAEARAATRARRIRRAERREGCFKLFVSGFSHHEIAAAMKVSAASVRRLIDQAIRERRLDAPERYAQVQVARLSKALCLIDHQIEQGDARAVTPLLRLVAALDRYHGLEAAASLSATPSPGAPRLAPRPAVLALTHQAPSACEEADSMAGR